MTIRRVVIFLSHASAKLQPEVDSRRLLSDAEWSARSAGCSDTEHGQNKEEASESAATTMFCPRLGL